jgi:hypothetical protein
MGGQLGKDCIQKCQVFIMCFRVDNEVIDINYHIVCTFDN